MTPLLVLLGAALCSLTMSTEIVPQPGFDLKAAEGKWYLIGIATNSQSYINKRDTMKMGIATLTSTAEGHMRLSYASLNEDGSCLRKRYRANKTDVPGKFLSISKRGGIENHTIMVEIKYDNFALVYDIKKKKKGDLKTVRLFGRTDEVIAEVKEKFRQLAHDVGTQTENIFFLPKSAPCPPA